MRQLSSLLALCALSSALPYAFAQAAANPGPLTASDVVGVWEIDRESTIRRAVENAPDDEKERVKQELTRLLPQQIYAFEANGSYKVRSITSGRTLEDKGTFALADDKLTLTSSGAGGTRSLDLTRDNEKLLLAGQLVLARTTPEKLTAPPQPAAPARQAERPPAPPARRTTPGSIEQTTMAGTKGDKTLQTVISRTDRMIGFVFEMTDDGNIANLGSVSLKHKLPQQKPGQLIVTGQPGYVLHGVYVDAKERVNAMCLVFVRVGDDDRIVPGDTYVSDWIGKPTNQKPLTLGCDGKRVVGFGRSTKDGLLTGFSLSVKEEPSESAAPAAPADPKQADRIVAMLSEAATILESVTDSASAKQARERLDALAAKNQNVGALSSASSDRIQPLMQRIDAKLKSLRQTLPDEAGALQASLRNLAMGTATPEQRAAATEAQKRILSGAKLKQIAVAVLLREQDGKPAVTSLDELVKDGSIKPDVLDSPMGDAQGGDFVYIRPGGNPQETVLLYDAAALSAGGGTNVAFVDGSVQWLEPAQLKALNIPRSK